MLDSLFIDAPLLDCVPAWFHIAIRISPMSGIRRKCVLIPKNKDFCDSRVRWMQAGRRCHDLEQQARKVVTPLYGRERAARRRSALQPLVLTKGPPSRRRAGDRRGWNRWLSSLDSTPTSVSKGNPDALSTPPAKRAPNGTFKKCLYKTITYEESSITVACYLCNTHRKRRGVRLLEAVPLLRVQMSSVIVILRRRGASRGRPVLGGSLKSLAFMRECPKARSD
jgi:hypothetical protein